MGPESEELFSLYLKLHTADSQFLDLIEEDLERKQFVLGILSCSSTWNNLANHLKEQTAAYQRPERPSANNQGSS